MLLLKKRSWLIIALSLTMIFILRLFPAHWFVYTVQQFAPNFQADGIAGTVWQGKASYAQWSERGHALPLGELHWQINIASLFILTPCIDFTSHAGSQKVKGEACYSILSNNINIEELDISLPIANAASFFGVDLSGNVTAFIKSIEINKKGFANVNANLLWEQASIYNGNEWLAVGNVQAKLSDSDGNLTSKWQHISDNNPNPVELDLTAKLINVWAKKPTVQVNGLIKPLSRNSGFEPMLRFIGSSVGDGSYRIDFTE